MEINWPELRGDELHQFLLFDRGKIFLLPGHIFLLPGHILRKCEATPIVTNKILFSEMPRAVSGHAISLNVGSFYICSALV